MAGSTSRRVDNRHKVIKVMTSMEPQPSTPTGRFAVSESGMRELNIRRDPWDLVKELIQNAWDESPFATECRVTVEPQADGKTTRITVEDDGPGFDNIDDAYTLMGPTSKRLSPTKRGRFNIGEKDVISVAIEAEVETVRHTVTFPRTGAREQIANSRTKGTVVRVLMPWNVQQSDELVLMLQRFRPPANCRLLVNGLEVPHRPVMEMRTVGLQTVAQDALGKPMRVVQRRTEIHLAEPPEANGKGWLYEMGIPVLDIECPWDVDVMQKIPMGQQRDAVSKSYLNRIYAEALNATHGILNQDDFTSDWVKRALIHPQTSPEAVKSVAVGRYGPKAVFASLIDRGADQRAMEAGYRLIESRGLSKKEIEAFRTYAGVKYSDEEFSLDKLPPGGEPPKPGSDQARFAEWVIELAGYCGLKATVLYLNDPANTARADCDVSTETPIIRFNEGRLGKSFFQPPYESTDHYDLVIHELGHALSNLSEFEHGEEWGKGVGKAGALIAVRMLQDKG